ncbi:MAG: PEP-CTERM sorting domain-containing protein [Mariniblastus sp.]
MFPTFVRGAFTLGNETGDPYDLADTFFLETNPGASQTIYLDFDGHHSVNNVWGHDLVFDAFNAQGDVNSFTDAELRQIQTQFQNVAEDFIPFDVNVTTRDPGYDALVRSNAADTTWGLRMLNTQNIAGSGAGGGGTAYVNSFNWIDDRDNIAFAFNKGGNNGGMTNSHEIGHTLGLRHDGIGSTTYHPGTGSGDTRWGPLMGAPFNANITQWSNGDYANSTNQEDDLAIITKTANGINYRADQIGDTLGDAGDLVVGGDGTIFDWNIIEQNTDFDVFKFTAGDGQLILQIDPFSGRPNLDILAELYDASGTLLDTSNPIDGLNAAFDLAVTQGDYYLSITGTGRAGTYSDYGSLGFYTISGSAPLSSVPEPSSVLILMIGLGCVVGKRRRRNLV